MEKVRLIDIAEQLGLSVATVSNVLNGKHHKISYETEKRVLQAIEESGYLPSRAEVLLGRNPRSLIGFVVNDHPIYNGRPFEDPYISQTLSALLAKANQHDLDLVVRSAKSWEEISDFASTWNMKGVIVSGFCKTDYESLKSQLHIPLVVYNGGTDGVAGVSNDDRYGGRILGHHLIERGHKEVLCLIFAVEDPDLDRVEGLAQAGLKTTIQVVPPTKNERLLLYETLSFTSHSAVFCTSDQLAMELIRYLQDHQIQVPEQVSVCGFDGIPAGAFCHPSLTTVVQNCEEQAKAALSALFNPVPDFVSKPVLLVRESTGYGKDIST